MMTTGKVKSIENTQKGAETSSPIHAFARQPNIGDSQGGFGTATIPQMAGNQAVQQLFRTGAIQAKLAISQPGDPDEQEADRVAQQVVSMPAASYTMVSGPSSIQQQTQEKDEMVQKKSLAVTIKPLQRSPSDPQENFKPGADFEARLGSSGGNPLPARTRAFMDPRFGVNFSHVRVHTDNEAVQMSHELNAQAFTHDRDIYFGAGKYNPESSFGRQLLAHELTHVIQQTGGIEHQRTALTIQKQSAVSSLTGKFINLTQEDMIQRQAVPVGSNAVKAEPPTNQNPFIPKILNPKGRLVVHNHTEVTFTDDPEYVNYQIQEFIARPEKGLLHLDAFINADFLDFSFKDPFALHPKRPPTLGEEAEYVKQVKKIVHDQAVAIKGRTDDFRNDFQRRAVDTTCAILDESKKKIEEERDRYGIKKEEKTILGISYGTNYKMADNKATADFVNAAKELLSKQQAVAAAKEMLDKSFEYGPHGELPPGGAPDVLPKEKQADAQNKLLEARQEYNQVRKDKEAAYPVLVSYQLEALDPQTPETLKKLASDSRQARAETLEKEISNKLENIETVRTKVTKDNALIWNLRAIIEATRELPDIKLYKSNPVLFGSLKDTVVVEKMADEEFIKEFTAIALGVLSYAASLLATPVAGALIRGVAIASEGALAAAMAVRSLQTFQFAAAASGTDFDKAKAISQEEPSLFWLALDLIGGAQAIGGSAKQVFRLLRGLRNEALAAKAIAETGAAAEKLSAQAQYQNALDKLKVLGDDVVKPSTKQKLIDNILNSPITDLVGSALKEAAFQTGMEILAEAFADEGVDDSAELEIEGLEYDFPLENTNDTVAPMLLQRTNGGSSGNKPPVPKEIPKDIEFEKTVGGMMRRGTVPGLPQFDHVIRGNHTGNQGVDFWGIKVEKPGRLILYRVEVKGGVLPTLPYRTSGIQTGRDWTLNAIEKTIGNEQLSNLLADKLQLRRDSKGNIDIARLRRRLRDAPNVIIVHKRALLSSLGWHVGIGHQVGGLRSRGGKYAPNPLIKVGK